MECGWAAMLRQTGCRVMHYMEGLWNGLCSGMGRVFKYQNFKISRFCNDNKLCIFAYMEFMCLICQPQSASFLQLLKQDT